MSSTELIDAREGENTNIESDDEKATSNKVDRNPKKGRVFVTNLSFKHISEEKLKSLFSKYGEITEVNLPKKDSGELKGFGFIQFVTKKDALVAIKEMDNKKLDGRKIHVRLAVSKEDYKKVEEDEKVKDRESRKQEKIKSNKERREKQKDEKPSEAPKRPVLNDPARTIFVRNLGFSTDEDSVKDFFNSLQGNVLYAKICKDPQTRTSKGTGFVMFKEASDVESVMSLYHKYNNRDRNEESSSLNPFELEGRNLKLFPALSKTDAQTMSIENKNKDKDPRHRHLLYYGLSPSSLAKHISEEQEEISEEDKERREKLIKLKKTNFTKNPNYHVSETRLTLRNFDKNVNEDHLKKLVSEKIVEVIGKMSPEDLKKFKYDKIKKIKQIKILREKTATGKDDVPKSKCVAFIEVCDHNLAKELLHSLTNIKLNKKKNKGLIVDFALDDSRKLNAMKKKKEGKLERERERDQHAAEGETTEDNKVKKPPKVKKVERKNNDGENTIKDINDIKTLLDIYSKTVSRGKKQRVKNKLRALGYTEPLETVFVNMKSGSLPNENSAFSAPKDNFVTTKINTNKTNLNQKLKDNQKKLKKGEQDISNDTNLLNNKRKRTEDKKAKAVPVPKVHASRLIYNEEIYSDDSGEEDETNNPYFAQIMENLKKSKK